MRPNWKECWDMNAALTSWKYAAETSAGEVVSGVVQAADEQSALASLRSQRLAPLSLEATTSSGLERFSLHRVNKLSLADLAAVTRRISNLIGAGLPLIKALELAGEQATSERQRKLFAHLASEVRAGRALSVALANGEPKAPSFTQALARTGENIGALPAQFSVLADHYERSLKIRREITAQLVYPAALMVLITLTMIFLSFFVLPQFEVIFENASAVPPIETRIALATGTFIRSNLVFAPVMLLFIVLGWRFAAARYQPQLETAMLTVPVVGRWRRDYEIGRYCRSLATMLSGGMALSDAMPLAADTVQLSAIRSQLINVEAAVRTGQSLSIALAHYAAPAKEVISFLEVGDETGTLAAMSREAAHFSEERINSNIKRFMALLSPALTAIMGLVTAGVIAAVMSGVLSLNDAVY